MAQKRMFDKGLIETDSFMDMPMPTKALYFLLGMEADDEGFVSPNRVMRIYGGNADDLKVLIAKGFVIQFESGVIVITDWKKNNWLDSRRIKETVHQAEKKLLGESKEKYFLLSNGLANAEPEERRVEENSREEKEEETEKESPDKPEKHLSYLKEIPKEDIKEFVDEYKVTEEGLKAKAADLLDWCEANGKRKKNYKAFLRVAVKKDFGKRTEQDKIQEERIRRTRESIAAGPSQFAKSLSSKMKM